MAIEFDPDEIVRSIGASLIKEVNFIAGTFLGDVVPRTPVDTGHARRNWQVNISAPSGQELPGVDASGQGTVSTGKSKLKASTGRNPFSPVFIENNVPYIGLLNEGSSMQAPAMFVDLSLVAAVNARANSRENI